MRRRTANFLNVNFYKNARTIFSLRDLTGRISSPISVSGINGGFSPTFEEIVDGTLEAWSAGGDVFISNWYSQGTQLNSVAPRSAGGRPKIVEAGSLITHNGKPFVKRTTNYCSMRTPQASVNDYFGDNTLLCAVKNDFGRSSIIGSYSGTNSLFWGINGSSGLANNGLTVLEQEINGLASNIITRDDAWQNLQTFKQVSAKINIGWLNSLCIGINGQANATNVLDGMYDGFEYVIFSGLQSDSLIDKIRDEQNLYYGIY